MNSGIASLYKILKDDNRKAIILTLNKNGGSNYTALLESLDFTSTGLLNYHLKVLGDLLTKNEEGEYSLTERGRLAVKLLQEFPEQIQSDRKAARQKIWGLLAVGWIFYIAIMSTAFFLGYRGLIDYIADLVFGIGMICLMFLGYKLREQAGDIAYKQNKRFAIVYVTFGGIAGSCFAFFGTIFIAGIWLLTGGPNLLRLVDSNVTSIYLFLTYFFACTFGGCLGGYYLGKRNEFKQPEWGKWIEDRFSDFFN